MKKITLLLILLTVSLGYSQQTNLEDFEGTVSGLAGFEGLGSASVVSGALELVSSSAGQPWQGAELLMQNNKIDLSSDNTINLDIFSNTAFDMFVKVENGTGPDSATATAHGGTGLETITFTFDQSLDGTAPASGEYEKIVFFLNWNIGSSGWNNPGADFTITVDNITAAAGTALSTKDFKIAGLSMYPNPTQDAWNIKTQKVEMTAITVFDVLGKSVLSMTPKSSEVTIEARSLRTGLYFAKIETANGSQTVKLIKK